MADFIIIQKHAIYVHEINCNQFAYIGDFSLEIRIQAVRHVTDHEGNPA